MAYDYRFLFICSTPEWQHDKDDLHLYTQTNVNTFPAYFFVPPPPPFFLLDQGRLWGHVRDRLFSLSCHVKSHLLLLSKLASNALAKNVLWFKEAICFIICVGVEIPANISAFSSSKEPSLSVCYTCVQLTCFSVLFHCCRAVKTHRHVHRMLFYFFNYCLSSKLVFEKEQKRKWFFGGGLCKSHWWWLVEDGRGAGANFVRLT